MVSNSMGLIATYHIILHHITSKYKVSDDDYLASKGRWRTSIIRMEWKFMARSVSHVFITFLFKIKIQ